MLLLWCVACLIIMLTKYYHKFLFVDYNIVVLDTTMKNHHLLLMPMTISACFIIFIIIITIIVLPGSAAAAAAVAARVRLLRRGVAGLLRVEHAHVHGHPLVLPAVVHQQPRVHLPRPVIHGVLREAPPRMMAAAAATAVHPPVAGRRVRVAVVLVAALVVAVPRLCKLVLVHGLQPGAVVRAEAVRAHGAAQLAQPALLRVAVELQHQVQAPVRHRRRIGRGRPTW
mmetsp:Transcript_13820/g.21687  ORF Transcript_13820/g.21687 Transcript_13820/m.21687 type:complete len:227 (-) Transcript_13820:112-792(-)